VRVRGAWRYIAIAVWTVFVTLPIYWMVITAFKDNSAIYNGARWLPWVDYKPTLEAWHEVLGGTASVIAPLEHSLIIATSATAIAVFFGSLAGYGLARFPVKLGFMRNDDVAFFIVSQRIMPPVVVVLAFFIVYKKTVLQDATGYSIFGKVTSGMDIVDKIAAAGATPPDAASQNTAPMQPISILKVDVAEKKA